MSDSSGSKQITESKYDKNDNVIKKTISQVIPGQKEPQVMSEQITKDYKVYYTGK